MTTTDPKQLPDGYRQRVDTYTRRIMHQAQRLWDIVREFCGDQYVAQATDNGLVVRIYKGEAPDCLACNDRKWLVRTVERNKGFLIPEVFACPACNEDGMQPPKMEGKNAAE